MTKQRISINRYSSIAAAALFTGALAASSGSAAASTMSRNNQASATMHSEHMQSGHGQAAADLRVGLNNLVREHVSVSLDVTRSIAGNAPESKINGAIEAQYANSDALSAAVGSVYGGEAQSQFSDLFREHIAESNAYAVAVADNDQQAKQAAVMELQEYLNDIAMFFSGAIPGLQTQDVYGLLNEHEELINKSTEAYKAGDFVQSYQLEREALKQASRIADTLASAIIASQPATFQ